MSEKNLRKVKMVNGWKVNHPHSGVNIFYMLLCLILLASPLVYMFLTNGLLTIDDGAEITKMSYNGIDLIKSGIEFIKYLFGMEYAIDNPVFATLMQEAYTGQLLHNAIPYFFLISAAIMAIMIIFSVVLFIIFMVHIVRGYLRNSRAVKSFAALDFSLALSYSIISLLLFICYLGSDAGKADNIKFEMWNVLYINAGYLVLLIIIAIVYTTAFKDSIQEGDLEFHDDAPTAEHVTKVHEVTKVKYEQSSTLPPNITSIGGHAFAENQSLVVANIPIEVTKIGNSAFANCLKLKVVSIPDSVNEIGFNCFFNCVELERINYSGTKEQWKKIARGSNWLAKAGTTEVTCIDGVIIVNPYH